MKSEKYRTPFLALGILLCLNVGISMGQYTEEEMTVNAGDLGLILGKNASTLGDRVQHLQFYGIPFAQPVTVANRFLPSKLKVGPLTSDGSIFPALTYGTGCNQPSTLLPVPQDEDCLFINIWTRRVFNSTEGANLRPVIFFIHGGGFTIGSGSTFSGTRLLNRDVVYVTFNYRLGVLGFFCLDNAEAPGNAGMYDVITALDWVRKYIHHFGGDPNSITIGGHGSGSTAVTLLMVSPLARGKFHKVIAASGTILNTWSTGTESKKGSLTIAKLCGCYNPSDPKYDEDAEVLSCMKRANSSTLVEALFHYQMEASALGGLGFEPVSPVVQLFDTEAVQKIFPEMPSKVFEEGRQEDVPLLIGTTRHDGSYALGMNYQRYLRRNNLIEDIDFMKTDLVPTLLRALGIADDSFGIYESIARTYLGDSRFTGNFTLMLPGLMDIHNVFFYKAAAYRTATLHTQLNNNTFYYSFDYRGTQSLWATLFTFQPPPFPGGITHTDDMIYLYSLSAAVYNPQEASVAKRMLDYWVNFAEFGNPTPVKSLTRNNQVWPKLTKLEGKYMTIDTDSIVLGNYPDTWASASRNLFPHLLEDTTEFPSTCPPELTCPTCAPVYDCPTCSPPEYPTCPPPFECATCPHCPECPPEVTCPHCPTQEHPTCPPAECPTHEAPPECTCPDLECPTTPFRETHTTPYWNITTTTPWFNTTTTAPTTAQPPPLPCEPYPTLCNCNCNCNCNK